LVGTSCEIKDEINQDLDAAYAAPVADRARVSVQVTTRKTGGAITAELPEPSQATHASPLSDSRSELSAHMSSASLHWAPSRKRIVITVDTVLDG